MAKKPQRKNNGWMGIALLFVSVSIIYANYMVFFGTENLVSHIMLIPSTLFVAVLIGWMAWKSFTTKV